MKNEVLLREFDILSGALVGLEIEFYSNKTVKETAQELSNLLGRTIVVADSYHSDVKYSKDVFKLERDYSGGKKMLELVTGPLPYEAAKTVIVRVFTWIRQNGHVDEHCAFQPNISFAVGPDLRLLNKLRFCLNFDEDRIYKIFPERKNTLYARSIKHIYPMPGYQYSQFDNIHEGNFVLPSEKYYGVNFSKVEKHGYLEFRYMGGKDYVYKTFDILKLVDYFILYSYDMSVNNLAPFSTDERVKLKEILDDFSNMTYAFKSYKNFLQVYLDKIKVQVNLKTGLDLVESMWHIIGPRLLELLQYSDFKSGEVNYDSDIGKFQINNADISRAYRIRDIEIYNSKITGNYTNVNFYKCKIKDANLDGCCLMLKNVVENSKIKHTLVNTDNECSYCYIDIGDLILNGTVKGGIIRTAQIGMMADISEYTEVID